MPAVDAVIADPPYGIPHKYGVQNKADGGKRSLQFAWDGAHTTPMVLEACRLSTRLGQSHFWWCGLHQASGIADILLEAGLPPKPAAWVKECPAPAGQGTWWPSGYEIAVYANRPLAWFGDTNKKRSNVFLADSYRNGQPGKVDHPTQKPLGLITRLVSAMVPPHGTALDPFMGSGTTGVACVVSGRQFIGVEINQTYFDLACRRIEEAERQSDMFVTPPANSNPAPSSLRNRQP